MKQTNHLYIPEGVKKIGKILLDQQMWCWGQDVKSCGNLLIKFGFLQNRPPAEEQGGTAYILTVDDKKIILRGFGLFYSDKRLGGLFLKRYDFFPMLTPSPDLPSIPWRQELLPKMNAPSTELECRIAKELMSDMLAWIGEYEEWVVENFGSLYRDKCLSSWPKVVIPSAAVEWRKLSRRCKRFRLMAEKN